MILRPPRSTPLYSSAASDVYKRQLEYTRALFDILCQAYPRRCDNQRGGRDQLFHKRVSVFGRSRGLVGPTSPLAECAITIFLFCAFTITFCHAGESLRF